MEGAENQVAETQVAEQVQLTPEQLDFKRNMDFAFGVLPETEAANEIIPASIEQAQVPELPSSVEPQVDYNKFIKENFGSETLEEAKNTWKELQDLKTSGVNAKFEDEFSEKLFKAIKSNKKEANEILTQHLNLERLTAEDVTEDNADDIIKIGMQAKFKDLTSKEIDYQFKKQFALPKEPVQTDIEDDDDFAERKSDWKEKVADIKMAKVIEAKIMKPELLTAKSNLKFPDIEQVDPEFESYKSQKANNALVEEKIHKVIIPGIEALKAEQVPLGFKVNDANAQMDFDVTLAPTPEAFEKAKQDSLYFNQFVQKVSYDKDGNFKPENVQKLILLYENFDNYAQSIARQAVNAERKRVIQSETAGNNTGNRDYSNAVERTPFQKQMDYALNGY
ncbi:MAG: hypothetical protein H7320_08290 [Ferruginibacter sp.]|nr:hypothetical protein [Ferruginibacter sp.]